MGTKLEILLGKTEKAHSAKKCLKATFMLAIIIFLLTGTPISAQELHIGYQPSTHQLAAIVAAEKGWWKEDLKNFGIEEVKLHLFPSGPPEMTAMLAGDLDVAYVGSSTPIAAMYEGLDAKIVAGVQTQGSAVVIRPEFVDDFERDGVLSLKGKTIATYPPGSIQYTILSKWLLDNGIDPEKDLDIKAMAPSDAVSAIGAKSVDAVFLPSPYPELIEADGNGKIVKWSGDIWPNHACCCLVASGKLIKEHPDIVTQLIKTHINATEYVKAHPDEAAEIFVKWQGGNVSTIKHSIKISDSRWIYDPHLQIESSLRYARDIYELNKERYEAKGIKPLTEGDIFDTRYYDEREITSPIAPTTTPTPTPTLAPTPRSTPISTPTPLLLPSVSPLYLIGAAALVIVLIVGFGTSRKGKRGPKEESPIEPKLPAEPLKVEATKPVPPVKPQKPEPSAKPEKSVEPPKPKMEQKPSILASPAPTIESTKQPTIEIKRGYEILPNNDLRFGIRIKNNTKYLIADVEIMLDYPRALFSLKDSVVQSLANIHPNGQRTATYILSPLGCIHNENIEGTIFYKDHTGEKQILQMRPKEVHCVCPFLREKAMREGEFAKLANACKYIQEGISFSGINANEIANFVKKVCAHRLYVIQEYEVDGTKIVNLAGESIGEKAYYLLTAIIQPYKDFTHVVFRAYSDKPYGLHGFLSEIASSLRHLVKSVQSAKEIGIIESNQVINIIDSVVQRTSFGWGVDFGWGVEEIGATNINVEESVVQRSVIGKVDEDNNVLIKLPTAKDFQEELDKIFASAQRQGKVEVDVNSGDLHRQVGGYPGRNHRMPLCCEVMRRNVREGDQVLKQPPSGQGANLVISYKLPR